MSASSRAPGASTLLDVILLRGRGYAPGPTAASSFAQTASVPSTAPRSVLAGQPAVAAKKTFFFQEVLRVSATLGDCEWM